MGIGESQVDLALTIDWDWNAGFPLAEPVTPLDDILPGGTCDIESAPQRQVAIHEVEVSNFSLVQISVGGREIKWHIAHYLSESPESETYIESAEWTGGKNRRYRFAPPLAVQFGESLCVRLKNDGAASLKPKVATFVSAGSRAQNEVR